MATTFAVPDGRVAMAATTYTGTGATLAVSNAVNTVGMQPDLIWIKARNAIVDHALQSSVQGISAGGSPLLSSNTTAAETTYAGFGVSAVSSTGFTVIGNGSLTNLSTSTYVGWQWKAGGTAVSNTAGTITSSVSANTTAGFSVVTWTSTGASSLATMGHGLGVAPSLIITKNRTAVSNWITYHASLGADAYVFLNATNAAGSFSPYWSTSATTWGQRQSGIASNGDACVAYCWAPVAGYSAFGSYTGNGSADGPFIYTGFRPRWILIKSSTVATSWYLLDSARETYNEEKIFLYPDLPAADSPQSAGVDFLSNGFKVRAGAGLGINNLSGGYIYAAFAENPLKFSNAR